MMTMMMMHLLSLANAIGKCFYETYRWQRKPFRRPSQPLQADLQGMRPEKLALVELLEKDCAAQLASFTQM